MKQPIIRFSNTFFRASVLVLALWLVAACSNTRYLKDDQQLYVHSGVDVQGDITVSDKQDLRNSLQSKQLMLQQANKKFLGTRIKVWLYNQKNQEKKKNLFWNLVLSPKNMEEPSIFDSTKVAESIRRMSAYLYNQGYFYDTVTYVKTVKGRKVSVDYKVNTGQNFVIDSLAYDVPDTALLAIVKRSQPLSLIAKGKPYKQETLNSERERLYRLIKDAGYFKFDRNYIRFELDTLNKSFLRNSLNPFEGMLNVFNENKGREKPTLNIYTIISNPADSLGGHHKKYTINRTIIYPDYPVSGDTSRSTFHDSISAYTTYRYRQDIIRHEVLNRSVLLRHGETFSNQKYDATFNKLYDLGVWQFITINYRENRDTTLDALLYLTPRRRQNIGASFEVSTSSDYLLGSGVTLTWRHLNLHRSATSVDVNLSTGIELIRQDRQWVLQSKEFGGNVNFTFPKFITPFRISQERLTTVKTRLSLGGNYLSRVAKFDITNINASFGYDWAPSRYRRWIVNPISLNYVGTKLDPYFRDTIVNKNPYLKRSFEPAFIGGEVASYIYTNNDALHRKHYSFFRINLEESGLWLNGVNSLVGSINHKGNDLEDYTGLTISNFVKVDADYRHYWKRPRSMFATRVYTGVGVAYGHSTVLPYIRQFTAGGPNSLRAWRLRTLGPGSYHDTSATAQIFPDQTGDMKLEANAEFRFDLIRMFNGTVNLKGATFLDAGNIWMLRKDPDRPGSEFEFSQLYHDLALGTGVGLRLDFSFFIIRLDWGIPLKVPYYTGNPNGWYTSEWKHFSDPSWRRDNVIWNVAIGYPF